eukprot:m.124626 g.124626  ORF g.124626 m.124626 type:complete len:83 (-) comp23426_c0_seq6:214-462(-)
MFYFCVDVAVWNTYVLAHQLPYTQSQIPKPSTFSAHTEFTLQLGEQLLELRRQHGENSEGGASWQAKQVGPVSLHHPTLSVG